MQLHDDSCMPELTAPLCVAAVKPQGSYGKVTSFCSAPAGAAVLANVSQPIYVQLSLQPSNAVDTQSLQVSDIAADGGKADMSLRMCDCATLAAGMHGHYSLAEVKIIRIYWCVNMVRMCVKIPVLSTTALADHLGSPCPRRRSQALALSTSSVWNLMQQAPHVQRLGRMLSKADFLVPLMFAFLLHSEQGAALLVGADAASADTVVAVECAATRLSKVECAATRLSKVDTAF